MIEQQLVDYIKKAREAKQTDDQSRNVLYKNGWTEEEIKDALMSLNQQQPQVKPQTVNLPKTEVQPQEVKPQVTIQPQSQPQTVSQPEQQYKPQFPKETSQNNMPQTRTGSHLVLKLLMV